MEPLPPVETAHLFPGLHAELIKLLRQLSVEGWDRPTVCAGWAVRDVAAHLLDGDIRKLSFLRDGLRPPPPQSPIADYRGLVNFLNGLNAEWVQAARRISPRLLVDLLALTGPQVSAYLASLDPRAPAVFPVGWAGEEVSQNWFDIGREYTERWHHQQQIRDALGAPALASRHWLHPVLAIFIRALPFTYRDVSTEPGKAILVRITGAAGGEWTLVRNTDSWTLFSGTSDAAATVTVDQDAAWRLFTKGLSSAEATKRVQIEGEKGLGLPFLRALAVMA